MKIIKVGSDFSGVGAFNQALQRLGVQYREIFACDMDRFARETFIHNYGEPEYYPTNVYEREIPSEPLDVYMTSPPCQAFSLAGKRLGKDDKRGVLFFNSHEFIQANKPRFFIFENVKGLLSDDNGNTFNEWVNFLGGKSVNGVPVLFPHEESVPYHLYWKVLNAKQHGVPQNRERVFLIGIRDDHDNQFRFPVEEHLTKRLKDVLEQNVDDKYFLSEKMISGFMKHNEDEIASCLRANSAICATDNTLKVKSATAKGYEEATEGDSINFTHPNSDTRRGRVGRGVAQTIDCSANQGVIEMKSIVKPLQIGQSKQTYAYKNNTIIGKENQEAFTIRSAQPNGVVIEKTNDYRIRRLTPRECFRLMDFPDSFTWTVSDSQAYKQAGNSIVVNVLYKLLKNLPL
jgi:DNA (cytosine-5)-methyltransferase 1